jgi:hypothetical protein
MGCLFKPADIKITDGTLNPDQMKVKEVPFIRFRKRLATKFPEGQFQNLKDAHSARERAVFVVNGERLLELLTEFKMEPFSRFHD